jgi:hypothetical protein
MDFNNDLDFDMASKEWRKNKVSLGNGYFAYRCKYIHSNGKPCNKLVASQKPAIKYSIREDWITNSHKDSYEYCQKHVIRGAVKFGVEK